MKHKRPKVDDYSIQAATSRSIEWGLLAVLKSLRYLKDEDKKTRLEKSECRYCYYFQTPRIGGRAITESVCGICDKKMMFPSTVVSKFCLECGIENDLCINCGGDLHQRVLRRLIKREI